jgi:hypothetical protein
MSLTNSATQLVALLYTYLHLLALLMNIPEVRLLSKDSLEGSHPSHSFCCCLVHQPHNMTGSLAPQHLHIKVGSAQVISADFARCGAVTWMLKGWNSLFQSKKYIRSNILTLYQRKDTPLIPTHV